MENTVVGRCTTNLDDYVTPITEFYHVPKIGERVVCMYKGHETTLKVCQITHAYNISSGRPYIIVELNN